MHTPIIEFENTTDSTIYRIRAVKWDIKRIYVRFRYDYINGATGFNYRSYKLLFEFEWPYMEETAYNNLKAVVESIADGDDVRINSIGETAYSIFVDLDKDDFPETSGEYVEKKKIKTGFISKDAQSIV